MQGGKDEMIKGQVSVSGRIRYRIHATPRQREGLGTVISSTRLDELDSTVVIYDSGAVVVESPRRYIEYDLQTGSLTML